ncbi:DUF4296 domain-containing protein [Olleya marilimosa]|uniref:DUF4296 domain-containing protein n=1 Tax=Olleya marilimosa TaxID=272164 RepID=A0ABR8LYW1_9FLAO|nr:DUF4296 domain-containing protein [Olleya marilimosa]MBD3864164.1 DUF4296 domain-containing protein [Olleya marilimosa]MBD3891494.1 DUF4296 domain-containing protein [Olleya marilimosa]PIB33547.1 hypothetical protein BFP78_04620 [Gaetbulibacter sp. 5U11]
MLKQNIVIYIFITLLFVSCYGIDRPKKPENLMSKDKMVDVLVELALVSSAKGINKRELENKGIVPDTFVYKKHKIDSTIFANSNNYYAYDIDEYSQIYKDVRDSLESLRIFYKDVEKKENLIKDKELKETLKDKVKRVKTAK